MEMFKRDSDYEWNPVSTQDRAYTRYTMMDCSSAEGRARRDLKRVVYRALDELAPSVLVVNGWGHRESRASLCWARSRRCPTVLLSDSVYENLPRNWYKELYKKWVVRNCASAFVAGTPQARYAVRLGIPKHKVFHPGSCVIDNEYWRIESQKARENAMLLRSRYNLPDSYFLCVARFLDIKNLPFLVRAFAAYKRHTNDRETGLVLIGSGPDEDNIRAAIRESGLRNVLLPGFLQADVTPIYYALASCFVLPSARFECWGLVVNEAMACGLPVLVSDQVGCAEDLVRYGENGYTFDPTDINALAQLMARVIGDDDKRARMGVESQRIIAGHSCDIGAQNLWKAVDAAIS